MGSHGFWVQVFLELSDDESVSSVSSADSSPGNLFKLDISSEMARNLAELKQGLLKF